MFRVTIFFLIALFPLAARADRCVMTGGCVGEVGYMHVPQSQRNSAAIFVKSGLPDVNSIATLKVYGHVFLPEYLNDPRLPEDLAGAVKNNKQLAWGEGLESGAKIRALGYQTFPQQGPIHKEYSNELFLLVLIITDH